MEAHLETLAINGRRKLQVAWRRVVAYDPNRMTVPFAPPPRMERRRRAWLAEAATFCRLWDGAQPARINLERCLEEDWFFTGLPDRTYLIWLELYERYMTNPDIAALMQAAAQQSAAGPTFRSLAYFFAVEADEWLRKAVSDLTAVQGDETRTPCAKRRFREACLNWGAKHGGGPAYGEDLLNFWEAFGMTPWLTGQNRRPPLNEQAFALLAMFGVTQGKKAGEMQYWLPFVLTQAVFHSLLTETAWRGWLNYETTGRTVVIHPINEDFSDYVARVLNGKDDFDA